MLQSKLIAKERETIDAMASPWDALQVKVMFKFSVY